MRAFCHLGDSLTIINNLIYFQEDKSSKYSKIQQNVLQKKEQHKIDSQTSINLSENIENDNFTVTFLATKSVDDLLDMGMSSNLSASNALKLITRITNEISSGKSKVVNIETDQRFIHLRKIVMVNNQIKPDTGTSFSDDLSQYTQLSTPAMITVSTIVIISANKVKLPINCI